MAQIRRMEAINMAVLLFIGVIAGTTQVQAAAEVSINAVNFPDEVFREYVAVFDTDWNGSLSEAERKLVGTIDVQGRGIRSLKGVEHFEDLRNLSCEDNELSVINVSYNSKLEYLDCSSNLLTELDVKSNTFLTSLYCQGNRLGALDVRSNPALSTLNCSGNRLTELNLTSNPTLSSILCENNRLTSLDLSANRRLESIDCSGNRLCSLDLSGLAGTDITLDASGNHFHIGSVAVGSYDLGALTDYGFRYQNAYSWAGASARNNVLRNFTSDQVTYSYSCGKGLYTTFTLTTGGAPLSEDVFPDSVFREYMERYDADNDGALSVQECGTVKELSLSDLGIASLKGIEYLTGLETLYCNGNRLTSLDLSGNTMLGTVWANDNLLSELNVAGCGSLVQLFVHNNRLTSLDVADCVILEELNCGGNSLSAIDLSACTGLRRLTCSDNRLEMLSLESCPLLEYLNCSNNRLTSLDLDACDSLYLENLWADGNSYSLGAVQADGYNLELLHKNGFSEGRAYNWKGADCDVSVLKNFTSNEITYSYDCGNDIVLPFKLAISNTVHVHSYRAVVTAPTCTASGYTTYLCDECGDSYKSDYVAPLGHIYGTAVTKATTKVNGSVVTRCTRCGSVKERRTIASASSVTLSSTSYSYNGSQKKPKVTVKDSKGAVISDDYYKVTYTDNVKAGKGKAKVTLQGLYSGSLTAKFTIRPPATSIVKKKGISKGIRIYWEKRPRQISGYQVSCSTSSKFTKKTTKTVKVATIGATYRKVTGLSAGKTYYVRIRTYVKVNGSTYYSTWSKAVKVKTKK